MLSWQSTSIKSMTLSNGSRHGERSPSFDLDATPAAGTAVDVSPEWVIRSAARVTMCDVGSGHAMSVHACTPGQRHAAAGRQHGHGPR